MLTSTTQRLDANHNPIDGLTTSNFVVTATHATLATATKAAVTGSQHVITDIIVSTDLAGAVVTVKQGTTSIVVFTMIAGTVHIPLQTFLEGALSALVSVSVTGTSACYATIIGFSINPLS